MMQSNVYRRAVLLSGLCMFLLTIAPLYSLRIANFDSAISSAEPKIGFLTELSEITHPEPRFDASMAYDSESDRMIMFGGVWGETPHGSTWSFDVNENKWTNMSPALTPPGWVAGGQMAYDSGSDRIIIYGGGLRADPFSFSNETWAYDYNSNSWVNMTTAITPGNRYCGSMAYDSESDVIILFGGFTYFSLEPEAFSKDTWAYDFEGNTWTNMTTALHPSIRYASSIAYDNESDKIVLFGGDGPDESNDDTWSYDYNSNTWTLMSPAVSPLARRCGELAYANSSDRIILFGGANSTGQGFDDTWSYDYDSDTWTILNPEPHPLERELHRLAYDIESDLVILFCGIEGGTVWDAVYKQDITWTYNLETNIWNNMAWDWMNVTPTESPLSRRASGMTYDVESDKIVMFGGNSDEQLEITEVSGGLNDTWCYDFNTNIWADMSPSIAPSPRYVASMVYDEESDLIVLFGGLSYNDTHEFQVNDTWTYNLNTNTWTEMSPMIAPEPRSGCGMTYDSESDLVILFGGFNEPFNDTWVYDVNTDTWTELSPELSPAARGLTSMVYDEESELVILYGGRIFDSPYQLDDTWTYNYTSNTWIEMNPIYSPSARSHGSLVYDIATDTTILFGGWDYYSIFDETWSYDYNTNVWFEMNTPNNPTARHLASAAYDSESNRTVLFCGAEGIHYDWYTRGADTWVYKYQINPPSGPLNIQVTVSGENLVLNWESPNTHAETPITGYKVYRGTESGMYDLLAEVGNVLTYTDTTVASNIRYYYVVTALTNLGEGDYSDEESGIILLDIPDDGVFSFIVYGDSRGDAPDSVSSLHDDIVALFLQDDPELILHTGDLVNHGGESYQWPLFEASISAIRDADIPFYSAVGNHEIYTDVYGVNDDDYSTYLDYVDFSSVVDTPGETELYYSFDLGGIHFIFLNNVEEWNDDNYTCPTAQMTWLSADLESTGEDDFIVVSFHYPAYSIREARPDRWAQAESIRNTFHSLFVDYDVDIVFNGHDHHYYRTLRDDIFYVTTAGGGAPLYGIETDGTVWQSGDVAVVEYHYCVVTVSDNSVSVQVLLMNGTAADSFAIERPISTTTTTDSTTNDTTSDTTIDSVMIIIVIGVGGVVIVIIVVVFISRKRGG